MSNNTLRRSPRLNKKLVFTKVTKEMRSPKREKKQKKKITIKGESRNDLENIRNTLIINTHQ